VTYKASVWGNMQHAAVRLLKDMRKAEEIFPQEYSDCTEAVADMVHRLRQCISMLAQWIQAGFYS